MSSHLTCSSTAHGAPHPGTEGSDAVDRPGRPSCCGPFAYAPGQDATIVARSTGGLLPEEP
jgi:hypothetical protein